MDVDKLTAELARDPDAKRVGKLLGCDLRPLQQDDIRAWFVARPDILAAVLASRIDHGGPWALQAAREAGVEAGPAMATTVGKAFYDRFGIGAAALTHASTGSAAEDGQLLADMLSSVSTTLSPTPALALATWLRRLEDDHRRAAVLALAKSKHTGCRSLGRGLGSAEEAEAVWPTIQPRIKWSGLGTVRRCAELAPHVVIDGVAGLATKFKPTALEALAVSSHPVGTEFAYAHLASVSNSGLRQAMRRSALFRELVLTQTPKKKKDRAVRDELVQLWERRDRQVEALEGQANEHRADLESGARERILDEIIAGSLDSPARMLALREEFGEPFVAELAGHVREATFYRAPLSNVQPLWEALCAQTSTPMLDYLCGSMTPAAVSRLRGWQQRLSPGAWRVLADWHRWDTSGIGLLAHVRLVGEQSHEASVNNFDGDFPGCAGPWLAEACRLTTKDKATHGRLANALARLGPDAVAVLAPRLDLGSYAAALCPVAATVGDPSLRAPLERLLATKPVKKTAEPVRQALESLS